MNGRSARKRLMKNRRESFWGDRAFLTFRINPKVFPELCPSMDKFRELLGENDEIGGYIKKIDDNRSQRIRIANPSSSGNPLDYLSEGEKAENYLFLEKSCYDDWEWWEVNAIISPLKDGEEDWNADKKEIFYHTDKGYEWLKDVAEFYKNHKIWERKYLQTEDEKWAATPIGDAISEARLYSKTYYFSQHDGWYYLTFSVKYFYHSRMLKFCSAAKRLSKTLIKAGYSAKVS